MSAINHPVAPGLNTKLDPIDKFVSEGLQKRCRQVFCPSTAWVTSADKTKILQRMFGNVSAAERDTTIRYPYMLLTMSNVQLAQDRLHTKTTSMRGSPVVVSTDGVRSYTVSFLPVDFTVGVEFVAVTMTDVMEFSSRWLFAHRKNLLAFNVEYGQSSFSITTALSDSVSIPVRSTGGVAEYSVTCDMTVHGFISEPVLMDAQIAREVSVSHKIEATPSAGTTWMYRGSAPAPSGLPVSSTAK